MKGQRKFDDGIKSGKRSITRPHFLHHDPAVSGTEDMDHTACENRFRKPFGSLPDLLFLRRNYVQYMPAFIEIILCRCHLLICFLKAQTLQRRWLLPCRKIAQASGACVCRPVSTHTVPETLSAVSSAHRRLRRSRHQ